MTALGLIRSAGAEPCRPWPRHVLAAPDWARLVPLLRDDPLRLVALWADTVQVHALWLDEDALSALAVSTTVEDGVYPALSPARPGAALYERMVRDLWGHVAAGGVDERAWLDHGHWPHSRPLALRPGPPPPAAEPPELLIGDGEGLMQVPIGPVEGLIEPAAHLRLTMANDRTERAEARLGYAHKGTLALMRGKSPRAAARFAARLSAEATVAHSIAFAVAAEEALQVEAPPRAVGLRGIMLETERVAGHLSTLEAVAEVTGADGLRMAAGRLREYVLRACQAAFGHRLMMDCVVPGGLALDMAPDGAQAVLRAMGTVSSGLGGLRRMTERFSFAVRLRNVGRVSRDLVDRLAAGGVAGRAAGRRMDARLLGRLYADLDHTPALEQDGDAAARCRVLLAEIAESLRLIGYLLRILPDGATSVALPQTSGEGIGSAESSRGDVWHWLRLDHGQIASVFPRDPGWALWPLAEAAMRRAPFEDIGLIRASFGLSASGTDL
ncbi:MAG: hydrogenase expression protein HypE [Acetobacteraceae bacterium]